MPDDTSPEQLRKLQLDKALDEELEQTFPASDAPKITQAGSLPIANGSSRVGGEQARKLNGGR
jgi:hypothetical protein